MVKTINDCQLVINRGVQNKDSKMKGVFRCIFIGMALLAGCGLRGWGATPEFVDSLRTELGRRNIPERILFLPLALADQRADDGREGIWSLTAAVPFPASDTLDIRFDDRVSTESALDRLQELFTEYDDWNSAMVAFATSPTALAAMDSISLADAPILRSLRRAEEEYSENIPAAYERIGSLAARRRDEFVKRQKEQAELQKARLDSLRRKQAANTDRISYTIRRGDTLGGIAARYRVKVSDLKRWNNLRSDMIREGRKLVIYR